jgi:hypothetical protein
MTIIIGNERLEYQKKPDCQDDLFELIEKEMKKQKLEISYLIINGEPIYNNYKEVIKDRMDLIATIEVIAKDLKKLVDDILLSAQNYIEKGLVPLQKLANSFYQKSSNECWSELADLFEGIQWLWDMQKQIGNFRKLDDFVAKHEVWNEYVQSIRTMETMMPELERAVANKDTILIGDLILYEIKPAFENALEKLRHLTKDGGSTYVS